MTTPTRLRAAPLVILVLSFAVVLGLGWLFGPAPTVMPPPPPPSTAAASPPGRPATASPAPPPLYPQFTPVPSAEASRGSLPTATATALATATAFATTTALEPDANQQVHMGPVTAASRYPGSSLEPTVILTRDGPLQVCVRIGANQEIVDAAGRYWGQLRPPDGDRYCAYVTSGTDVTFTLESR